MTTTMDTYGMFFILVYHIIDHFSSLTKYSVINFIAFLASYDHNYNDERMATNTSTAVT